MMEKVLLAIDGIRPTRKAFHFAVQLCLRLKMELSVFQVIGTGRYNAYIKKIRRRMEGVRRYLENSMVAVTFAEAAGPETADLLMAEARRNLNELLLESEKEGVPFHLVMKYGIPHKEIIHYVKENRDVVLTIYDDATDQSPESAVKTGRSVVPKQIRRNLATPLLVVRN